MVLVCCLVQSWFCEEREVLGISLGWTASGFPSALFRPTSWQLKKIKLSFVCLFVCFSSALEVPFLGHTLLWKAVFTFWNWSVSSSKACRKHFRACWAWFRLKEERIQAQISMVDRAFGFFAQWRIPFQGCRYNERLSMRSLITAIGCCPHNLGKQSVSSKERGVLTSCTLLLLYEIFIPWIDPPPHWVKCLELLISFQSLRCTNAGTDTLLPLLMNKVSLILMWLYLQQGRKYYLHPPVLKNLGTFFSKCGFWALMLLMPWWFGRQPLALGSALF